MSPLEEKLEEIEDQDQPPKEKDPEQNLQKESEFQTSWLRTHKPDISSIDYTRHIKHNRTGNEGRDQNSEQDSFVSKHLLAMLEDIECI